MITQERFTVVTVEGDHPGRRARSTLLHEAGYHVLEAGSNEEAFRLAEREEAALLLLQEDDAERFRILADGAPVLMWMNGPDGCEFVNRAYLKFLGVSEVDVRGFDWAQYAHPDDRKGYVTAYLDAVMDRRLFEATFRFHRYDGVYRWMKSVGMPRFAADGAFLGYVGSTVDVTDLQACVRNSLPTDATDSHRRGQLHQWFRALSTWLTSATACIAGLVLVGWAFGLTLLTSLSSQFVSMKITTAVGFLCAAGSVLLLNQVGTSERAKALRIASIVLAIPVVLLGFGTLLGYALGWQGDVTHPRWMAQSTATCLVLLGIALIFVNRHGRVSEQLSEYSTLLVLFIAGVALIGYLYDKDSLYAVGPYSSMALHTALSFVLLGAALLCANPDRGLMATLSNEAPGAVMMRRLLPLTMGVLVISGWIRLAGEHEGWFGQHFGLTLLIGLNMVGFGLILWSAARSLNMSSWTLRESEAALKGFLDTAATGLIRVDRDLRYLAVNPAYGRLVGGSAVSIVGRTVPELLGEKGFAVVRPHIERVLKGERVEYEAEVPLASSGRRWLHVLYAPEQDSTGVVIGFVGSITDITERKRAERALQEQQQLLKAVTDNADVALFIMDERQHCVFMNPAAERLTGFTVDEVWARPLHEYVHHTRPNGTPYPLSECPIDQAFPEDNRMQGEEVFIHKDGHFYYVAFTASPLRDQAGVPVGTIIEVQDIKERKRAETALRKSEQHLELLSNSVPALIFYLDTERRYVSVNDAFTRWFGVAREHILGSTVREFVGEDAWAHIQPRLDRAYSGETVDYEDELPYQQGRRWVRPVYTPHRDASGQVVGVIVLVTDITERKQAEEALRESEERYRATFANAAIGISHVGLDGRWLRFNDAICNITGYSRDELERMTFMDVTHPEDVESDWSQAHRVLAGEIQTYFMEKRYIRKDQSVLWVGLTVSLMRDRDGKPLHFISVIENIDERKRGEAALRQAQDRLQRWNIELEQAVNLKTAELQQSQDRLRAMATELNLSEQRERKRIATELHDHLQQMLVFGKLTVGQGKRLVAGVPGGDTLLKTVDDMLSDALTYTRTLVADLSPTVLRDHGLAAALQWLGTYMQQHHQSVTVTVPDGGGLKFPEDQILLLFQCVRELLINSSKHAATGEATVRMSEADGMLQIEVQDDGQGFDFAAAGTPSGGISSKFGLFSIQERMRALGGSFEIQSAPGRGTIATLTLPLSKDVRGKALGVRSGEERRGHEFTALSNSGVASHLTPDALRIRVLLVDDHIMVRQGLRAVLNAYEDVELVGEAGNGEDAIRLVDQLRPAVVVMDINMPRMNGIEAAEQITRRHPDTIVIGISVNAADENQEAMQRAGAVQLMTKEAAAEELYDAILKAVKEREATA